MPLIPFSQSIAAGATFNPAAGSTFEYLPYPAVVSLGLFTTATGVLLTFISGSDILSEEGPIPIATANVFPKFPDDYHWQDVAAMGDRLKVNIRNTTGGALTVLGFIRIDPIAG